MNRIGSAVLLGADGGEAPFPIQHLHHPGVQYAVPLRGLGLGGAGVRVFVRLLSRHRVGEQAHRRHNGHDDADHHDPQGGAAVAQDVLNPALGIALVKGQGTGSGHPPAGGQGQQGGGIVRFDLGAQSADDGLITGGLDVPAHKEEGRPYRRVEPVDGQRCPAQGLDNVVQPPQVSPFVAEDELPGLAAQPGGEINFGPDYAQNKGRAHGGVLPGAVLGTDGVK